MCFTHSSTRMAAWLLHIPLSRIKEYRRLKINIIKQTVKITGCFFRQILRQYLGWFLSYHWKTFFLRGFNLKPAEGAQVLLKTGIKDFQNSLSFERLACFYVTISGNLNVFNTLILKQIFKKTKTFFRKLEYRFLVESTKIENASFSCNTALSEANVKTKRMMSTKWTEHKERSFASN